MAASVGQLGRLDLFGLLVVAAAAAGWLAGGRFARVNGPRTRLFLFSLGPMRGLSSVQGRPPVEIWAQMRAAHD